MLLVMYIAGLLKLLRNSRNSSSYLSDGLKILLLLSFNCNSKFYSQLASLAYFRNHS
jgi:hypothetical protein